MRADLHIHSTVSDGSNTMEEIVRQAVARGLTHISLTNHDTTEGTAEAAALCARAGLGFIPGVEFSAYDYANDVRAHILGYGMKDSRPIDTLGGELLVRRHENSLRQIEVLRGLGFGITAEEVAKKAGRHIYKQHIMHVMVERGFAESIGGETYRRLFKNNGPCAFDISYIDARDAIRAIREAGGIAVLAHPGQQRNFSSIHPLVRCGLSGLELEHHANTALDKSRLRDYADSLGLLLTGGSDHHGLYENGSPAVGDYLCPPEDAPLVAAV